MQRGIDDTKNNCTTSPDGDGLIATQWKSVLPQNFHQQIDDIPTQAQNSNNRRYNLYKSNWYKSYNIRSDIQRTTKTNYLVPSLIFLR